MSRFLKNSKEYLRQNWGAPFIIVFVILLIASAVLLSNGQSNNANGVAVYAFYALVLGVVLQIASYVKYGEGGEKKSEPHVPSSAPSVWKHRPGNKIIAVVIVVIVIIASAGSVAYFRSSQTSNTTTTTTTHTTIGHLVAGLAFVVTTPGPNNSVQMQIGINETGGSKPFNFTAYWSDGFNQTNDVGVFIRSILFNQSVPSSAKIVVQSADGQTSTVSVSIPSLNRTTTTTSKPSPLALTFTETGLPSGISWSVNLSGVVQSSYSSNIKFSNIPAGNFNYTVYDTYNQNFSLLYYPSPMAGSVTVTGTSARVNITYSTAFIGYPKDQISKLVQTKIISLPNGSQEFNLTYFDNFPAPINASIIAIVTSNTTGSIVKVNTTIALKPYDNQSAIMLVNDLAPGNYAVNFYAETLDGVVISENVTSTFTIA